MLSLVGLVRSAAESRASLLGADDVPELWSLVVEPEAASGIEFDCSEDADQLLVFEINLQAPLAVGRDNHLLDTVDFVSHLPWGN